MYLDNPLMKNQEESIRQIVEELHQLPEAYLDNVYEIVRTLRINLSPTSSPRSTDQREPRPFVDEIERVKEQSRDIPGQQEDQYLA